MGIQTEPTVVTGPDIPFIRMVPTRQSWELSSSRHSEEGSRIEARVLKAACCVMTRQRNNSVKSECRTRELASPTLGMRRYLDDSLDSNL